MSIIDEVIEKQQRLIIYEKMLKKMKTFRCRFLKRRGLCEYANIANLEVKHKVYISENRRFYYLRDILPEMYDYKPKNKKDYEYWFPLYKQRKRRNILREIIANLKTELKDISV